LYGKGAIKHTQSCPRQVQVTMDSIDIDTDIDIDIDTDIDIDVTYDIGQQGIYMCNTFGFLPLNLWPGMLNG